MSDLTHSENRIQPVSDERRAELLSRVYAIILSPEWEMEAVTVPTIDRSESASEQVDVQNE